VWIVLTGTIVFQTTLLFLPGLFSQDVFGYVAYGRLAALYDLNPYIWPPSAIARDAVLPWVADVWRTYPAPYGPAWLDVQWLMARTFVGASVFDEAMAYRLLANLLLLANLALAWVALGRLTNFNFTQRTTALAALAWNPLVLLEIGANAHNDVFMVTFSLLAIVLLARSNNGPALLSGASFTLGALVKYLSGVGLVWVAIAYAAHGVSPKRRVLRLAVVGLLAAAISLVIAGPWLELPDSLEPILAETVGVGFVNSLPDNIAVAVADHVLAPVGVPVTLARAQARSVERWLVLAAFGVYLLWEARRVWSDRSAVAVVRASARACLIYIVFASTSTQTWYFCLPLAIAVLLGWRASLTQVVVGYSVLALPALYLHYYLRDGMPFWVNPVYGLVPLVPALTARLRRRPVAPLPEPAPVGVGPGASQARMEEARR
jgi:hypothetical protein